MTKAVENFWKSVGVYTIWRSLQAKLDKYWQAKLWEAGRLWLKKDKSKISSQGVPRNSEFKDRPAYATRLFQIYLERNSLF